MKYRAYGQTGKQVSALGFGAMRFPDQENREACAELVCAAYDAGINYFDTAPGYGKSEELLGLAFAQMLPRRASRPFYVATKTFKQDPDAIRRDLETSLERMGLSCIDFFHMWCVMSWEDYLARKNKGALKAMERLRDEGLIRHLCVSTHMPGKDIGRLLEDFPFEGVLLGYSAMNFAYREEGVAAAGDLGRGVVVMNPLGGGIIPRFPERFQFLVSQPGETVVEAAFRFLLQDERITVALAGLSTTAQLAEAVRAVDGFVPRSPEELARIRGGLKESFDALCTGCQYCDHCPEDIPVPRFMDAYNHRVLEGEGKALVDRLRWHWGIPPDTDWLDRCTACGACVEACTQHLPILERFDLIRAELARAREAEPRKA